MQDSTSPEPTFPVVEIFGPTLQGEGSVIGLKTMFVRFGFCDGVGRSGWCSWCDSMEAVDPINKSKWQMMTAEQIARDVGARANETGTFHVTLTGGNPALHELGELVDILQKEMIMVNVETQGTVFRPWLSQVDTLTVSPKPPSAGEWDEGKFKRFVLGATADQYEPETCLKIVVDPYSIDDVEFARHVIHDYGHMFHHRVLSALTPPGFMDYDDSVLADYTRMLAKKVLNDPSFGDVRVLFQYHKFLWGSQLGV